MARPFRVQSRSVIWEVTAPINATTVAADGVLYVATMSDLFAIQGAQNR